MRSKKKTSSFLHPFSPTKTKQKRCASALAAVGKLRLPAALLTTRFKKLAATKQAQEERLSLPQNTPASSPSAAANGVRRVHFKGEDELATGDVEWAAMAEEHADGDAVEGGSGEREGGGGGGGGGEGRGHLMLLCRSLLACSASRTEFVRNQAAVLLAEADIPGALDALQVRCYSWRGNVYACVLVCVCVSRGAAVQRWVVHHPRGG